MDLKDGLELVQRLSGERPTKYGKANVWKYSGKAAVIVSQFLVTKGMTQPMSEVTPALFEMILDSFALIHSKEKNEKGSKETTLFDTIRKLVQPAESAQHIYLFCEVLVKRVSFFLTLWFF